METNERCIQDFVREKAETEGNMAFDKQRTNPVDVAKLRQWLESVSDYAEIVITFEERPSFPLKIYEAHRGPKTNLHPHGTFVLSVR